MSRLQVLDYFLLDSIFIIILKCAFFFRSTVTYQPDAYCFNTCSLRSRSNRPHSILSAVRGNQNFYNERLHDWCSCDTRETHSSWGRQNYALVSSFNHIPSLKYFEKERIIVVGLMLRGWRLQLASRGKRQSKSSNFKKEFSTQIFRVFPFFFSSGFEWNGGKFEGCARHLSSSVRLDS